jgi:hypothetical protein
MNAQELLRDSGSKQDSARNPNPGKFQSEALQRKELENAYKMIELYEKDITRLKSGESSAQAAEECNSDQDGQARVPYYRQKQPYR